MGDGRAGVELTKATPKPPARGYCPCCRIELGRKLTERNRLCLLCMKHQDDDRAGWAARDDHHRVLWERESDRALHEASEAYLELLAALEVTNGDLRDRLTEHVPGYVASFDLPRFE